MGRKIRDIERVSKAVVKSTTEVLLEIPSIAIYTATALNCEFFAKTNTTSFVNYQIIRAVFRRPFSTIIQVGTTEVIYGAIDTNAQDITFNIAIDNVATPPKLVLSVTNGSAEDLGCELVCNISIN